MDCEFCSVDEISALEADLIFPIAGAYFSGGQVDLYSDIVGEIVSHKAEPTGEFSGFDLRWARDANGLIKNLWEAKYSSFLTGLYDIVILTSDDRFKNDVWIEDALQAYTDSSRARRTS